MSLAGAGAGAAQGLDAYFAQLLQQQQGARGDRALDETVRKNKADEDYKLKALEDNNKTRLSVAGQAAADREAAQKDKEGTNLGKGLDELGDNSIVSPQTRSRALNLQAVPPERFKGYVPPSMGKSDPTQPAGQEEVGATPGGFPIVGSNASKLAMMRVEDARAARANAGVVKDTPGGMVRIGADNTANPVVDPNTNQPVHEYHAPHTDNVLIQTGDGYQRRSDASRTLAGGGVVPLATPAQARNRQDMAEQVGGGFADARQELQEAEKRGLLGPLNGRTFADFLARGVGSTGNPENDNLLNALREDLQMVSSGTASLHGRAGANAGIAKDIQKGLDTTYMSYDGIKGGLDALERWVNRYAKKKDGATPDGTLPTVGGTFQGGKVLRITPAQ